MSSRPSARTLPFNSRQRRSAKTLRTIKRRSGCSVRQTRCSSPWKPPEATGRSCLLPWPPPTIASCCSFRRARIASPARTSSAPGPTRSTRSASRASPPKCGPRGHACPRRLAKSCANSCACASGGCKTSVAACDSSTARSISVFPSSPALFTRLVHGLDSDLACAILHDQPTAAAVHGVSVKRLAVSRYDWRRQVGVELARVLIEAARHSVGHHHSAAHGVQIRCDCQDLDTLRRHLRELDPRIEAKLNEQEVGRLLTTSDGIGPMPPPSSSAKSATPLSFAPPARWPPASARSRDSGNRVSAMQPAPH